MLAFKFGRIICDYMNEMYEKAGTSWRMQENWLQIWLKKI